MKHFFLFALLITLVIPVNANSINAAAYRTIQAQSYRNNYRRQVHPMPYWQTQANYTTRGRIYQNYQNYSHYMNNAMYGNQYRGYRW